MINRSEFEGLGLEQLFAEAEQEFEIANRSQNRARSTGSRRPAGSRKSASTRRPTSARSPSGGRRPPTKARPRPGQKPPNRRGRYPSYWPGLLPDSAGSERVRWIQSSLNRILGLNLPVNGLLGVETRSAIRSFQKKKGLPVDGFVGPPTERALIEATGTPKQDSGPPQSPSAGAPPPADASAAEPPAADAAEPPTEELLEFFSGYEFPQGEFAAQPEYEDFQGRSNFRHRAICRRCGCGQSTEPEYGSAEFIPEFEQGEGAFGESEFSFSQIPQSILRLFRPAPSGVSAAPATYRPTPPSVPSAAPTSTGGLDIVNVRGVSVARQIASQVDGLLAAAQAAGVGLSGGGFRSPEKQIELRRKNCGPTNYDIYEKRSSLCSPPTAIPGQSNHERGLAIDFTYNGGGIEDHNNPGYKWLAANAARFGLYNLPSEPWHWSINGK